MARFRWITFCRALDVLEKCCTNAEFILLFEEHGLGEDLDAATGYSLTTPKLRNLLTATIRRNMERRDTEGELVLDVLVRDAATRVPTRRKSLFSDEPAKELPIFAALRHSLAVDGWAIDEGTLLPTAPIPLQDQRSRLRQNLADPMLNEALSRLEQYETALDAGSWEAANGIGRGFLGALFVAICQVAEQASQPREESDARKKLEELGFFAPSRQEKRGSPEAEFVFKLSGLMGTEGVHAGVSTQGTATYRYAMSLLTADYFMDRLKRASI
jgi:hypothetical protein